MKQDSLGQWLQVGANLGILIGLIFVAVQLYQDRELKISELLGATLEMNHVRVVALMGDDPATALSKLDTGEALDSRERFIVRSYFDARTTVLLRNSILENRGLMPEDWHSAFGLPDFLWANKDAIQYLENFEKNPFLSEGLRSQLSKELERLKQIVSSRESKHSTN